MDVRFQIEEGARQVNGNVTPAVHLKAVGPSLCQRNVNYYTITVGQLTLSDQISTTKANERYYSTEMMRIVLELLDCVGTSIMWQPRQVCTTARYRAPATTGDLRFLSRLQRHAPLLLLHSGDIGAAIRLTRESGRSTLST